MSMPRGGLLFNYWPLDRPGRPGDVVHRNWRIIARKVVGRVMGNDLDPDVKGKSQHGYLWTYSRPKGDVLFEWQVSRSREGPEEFLKDFRGKLQTDGYAVYESMAKQRGDLILVGCWAHVRRGFHEAMAETKLAAWFVGQIGQLYEVERKLRQQKAGPILRQAMRAWQLQPVLNRLHRAMELIRRKTLPQGLLERGLTVREAKLPVR
jgi:transposase